MPTKYKLHSCRFKAAFNSFPHVPPMVHTNISLRNQWNLAYKNWARSSWEIENQNPILADKYLQESNRILANLKREIKSRLI